ncbi:MAG: hypothetical protein HQK54_12690 [Oligoflexales bacterium]|nr:hypothetical protein [Oligoflexales bacterium]
MNSSDFIQKYLDTPSTSERIEILKGYKREKKYIPITISYDLLNSNLNEQEKIAILGVTDNSNQIAFEDMIIRGIHQWSQNMSSIALWEWAGRTECLLWHRMIPLLSSPDLPQRISYTLLDLAWCGGGDILIRECTGLKDLETLSQAFLGLLFKRSLQWNIETERLVEIARTYLNQIHINSTQNTKSIPYAIAYLLRFDNRTLDRINWKNNYFGIWPDIIFQLSRNSPEGGDCLKLQHILENPNDKNMIHDMEKLWPPLWKRNLLSEDVISASLALMLGKLDSRIPVNFIWNIFSGIPSKKLITAMIQLAEDEIFFKSLSAIGNLVHHSDTDILSDELRERLKKLTTNENLLKMIPSSYQIKINSLKILKPAFSKILEEREAILKDPNANLSTNSYKEFAENVFTDGNDNRNDPDIKERHLFMNLAYGGKNIPDVTGDSFWISMINAWKAPSERLIEDLSIKARKSQHIYKTCYIDTLGRFKGYDKAALKLLDFIRSHDEEVLISIVRSLSGIDTQRSYQEMISFLTRPNITINVQMEIASLLKKASLTNLQSELRSAISDLKIDSKNENAIRDLKESLMSLLLPVSLESHHNNNIATGYDNSDTSTTDQLDTELSKRISSYKNLSSETKRALRTAQFFQNFLASSGNPKSIDLSPAIDMQYKALELTFRELFENPANLVLNQGILQKKLDLIGYARPIVTAMDEFERYIGSLNTISSIPFFSTFKLRKMLRAICQFRRGKRFTLDGLKAFGLFFICFSRKSCNYGLANLFPIPGINDEELAVFCKKVHIFQDFRNRAAHEGFHPDASSDLEGIWVQTSEIIDMAFRIETSMTEETKEHAESADSSKKKQPVVIQKRAS